MSARNRNSLIELEAGRGFLLSEPLNLVQDDIIVVDKDTLKVFGVAAAVDDASVEEV